MSAPAGSPRSSPNAALASGDRVGLQLLNGSEYLEGMLAAFKLRAVPININYRYVERELIYLFDNADLRVVIAHRQFARSAADAAAQVEGLDHIIVVDDDTEAPLPAQAADYETALAAAAPAEWITDRSSDDIYCAYTGGTTGMPKGVLWRHEDIFYAALGGGDPTTLEGPISDPDQLVSRIPEFGAATLLDPAADARQCPLGCFAGPLRRRQGRPPATGLA